MADTERAIVKKHMKKYWMMLLVACLALCATVGCQRDLKNTVVCTEDQAKNQEALKVGEMSVKLGTYYLFLLQYVYNNGLQSSAVTDTLETQIIDSAIAEIQLEMVEYQMAQVTEGVEVSEEDLAEAETNTKNFIEGFGLDLLKCYGITEEIVRDLFTKQVYINAMTDKAIQDLAETYYEQHAEEYEDMVFQSMYYILFPSTYYVDGKLMTDAAGNPIQLNENEMKEQLAKAEEALGKAQSGTKLEDLAKEYGIEHCSGVERNYQGAYTEALNAAVKDLKDGELTGIVETDAGYMIVRMDNANDEDYKEYLLHYMATQNAKSLLPTLQQNWMASAGVSEKDLNTKVLGKTDLKLMCQIMEAYGFKAN